jgi:hypothetical protein
MLRLLSLALALGFASAAWADGNVVLSSGRVMATKDVSRLIHEVHVKDPTRDKLNADQIDALEANAKLFVERPAPMHLQRIGPKWVTDFIANDVRWKFLKQAPAARRTIEQFFDAHNLPHPATLAH